MTKVPPGLISRGSILTGILALLVFAAPPAGPAQAAAHPKIQFSATDRDALMAFRKTVRRLVPVALDLSNPAHRAYFLAARKAAGITTDNNKEFADFLKNADAYYAKHGKPKSALVFLVNGKLEDDEGTVIDGPPGPVLTVTSFQQINGNALDYGVSGLVSLPGQPQTCTQTLQVFDENGDPQGAADVNTQTLACESSLLYAEGVLDQGDTYASAHLVTNGLLENGTPFAYAMAAEGSSIPIQIVSTNPNDLNGDGMIKFCFGRVATDCDYEPAGGSQNNVFLPINGNTSWSTALVNPATDPGASVMITISQPQPQTGGGCILVGDVQGFMQNDVTLSNNNMTVNWNDQSVQFPPINSACMPNGSIVYYSMSMNVTLATTPITTPTFFGISSSPDTPISNGFFLMLPPTRVYYSCLAADSPVAMADGTTKAIADIRQGDLVVSGLDGAPLKVASVYVGSEDKPMVRLTTRSGRTLKLTEGHPVLTGAGIRLARFLKAGDVLRTGTGPSPIATIEHVAYGGKVYNLSLAAPGKGAKLADDRDVFLGDGILVGGNEMQWRYDRHDAQVAAAALQPVVPHISAAARALLAKRFGAIAD